MKGFRVCSLIRESREFWAARRLSKVPRNCERLESPLAQDVPIYWWMSQAQWIVNIGIEFCRYLWPVCVPVQYNVQMIQIRAIITWRTPAEPTRNSNLISFVLVFRVVSTFDYLKKWTFSKNDLNFIKCWMKSNSACGFRSLVSFGSKCSANYAERWMWNCHFFIMFRSVVLTDADAKSLSIKSLDAICLRCKHSVVDRIPSCLHVVFAWANVNFVVEEAFWNHSYKFTNDAHKHTHFATTARFKCTSSWSSSSSIYCITLFFCLSACSLVSMWLIVVNKKIGSFFALLRCLLAEQWRKRRRRQQQKRGKITKSK